MVVAALKLFVVPHADADRVFPPSREQKDAARVLAYCQTVMRADSD